MFFVVLGRGLGSIIGYEIFIAVKEPSIDREYTDLHCGAF
jgi:hypothetical protein